MPQKIPLSTAARLWLAAVCGALTLLFVPCAAQAQIQLQLKLNRHTYILYEPLIATVTITNNAGRDITFQDSGNKPWFNVEVYSQGGILLSPYDSDYKLSSLTLPAGQSVKRQIDLSPLFPIREMGPHRVRANVYFADTDRFFGSNMQGFDLTDGKVIWRQEVGAPGGSLRQMSLLTHRLPDRLLLYARVRDEANNVVYTTQSLNRLLISGREPEVMLDRSNQMHILHQAVPRTFLYTIIGINGERVDQKVYTSAPGNQPYLTKDDSGGIRVRGGEIQVARATALEGNLLNAPTGPKLSDRPMGLPVPKATSGRDDTVIKSGN
jgi:hypothetical protein